MKLSIELDDTDLQKLVHQQLGASISAITDDAIKTIVNDIINKKLERLTGNVVDGIVGVAAKDIIEARLGQSDYQRRSEIYRIMDATAVTIVRGAMK